MEGQLLTAKKLCTVILLCIVINKVQIIMIQQFSLSPKPTHTGI